jgi:hypothetical protein
MQGLKILLIFTCLNYSFVYGQDFDKLHKAIDNQLNEIYLLETKVEAGKTSSKGAEQQKLLKLKPA